VSNSEPKKCRECEKEITDYDNYHSLFRENLCDRCYFAEAIEV